MSDKQKYSVSWEGSLSGKAIQASDPEEAKEVFLKSEPFAISSAVIIEWVGTDATLSRRFEIQEADKRLLKWPRKDPSPKDKIKTSAAGFQNITEDNDELSELKDIHNTLKYIKRLGVLILITLFAILSWIAKANTGDWWGWYNFFK